VHDHALVEFVDEACTTVIPAYRVLCDDLTLLKEDQQVEVSLTNDSKLWARFILAGNSFCVCAFELMRSLVYLLLESKAYCKAEEDCLLDEDGNSSSNEDHFGDLEDDGEKPVNKKWKAEKEPDHALVEFVNEACTTVMPAQPSPPPVVIQLPQPSPPTVAVQPPPVSNVEEVATSSSGGLLSPELVKKLHVNSCSCRNFSAKLVSVTYVW